MSPRFLSVLVAAELIAGCQSPEPRRVGVSAPEVLARVVAVVRPAVERFAARASELRVASAEALPQAWRQTADAWQELAVFGVGPGGEAGIVIGGADLGEEIDSWPTSNPCRIDQEVVAQGWLAPDFFEANHVNVYGLDAMDYLLFAPADATLCAPQIPMRADGSWDALGEDEVRVRRLAYAKAVAANVDRAAQTLLTAWDPDEGDWGMALVEAGAAESPYPDVARALDDCFGALFYLDLVSKDLKLAKPTGLLGCSQTVCPDNVESRWARRSVDHLLANLRAARALAAAFDPLLEERGAASIGQELAADLDAATSALQSLPGDLAAVVVDDVSPARQAHAALKRATDLLKGRFVTVLALTLPDEGAGDND